MRVVHEWKKWNVDQKGSNRPAAQFGVRYHYNILVFVLLFVCVSKTTDSRHSMLFDGKFGDMGNFYWSREHLCVCSLYFPEKVIWGNFSFDNVYVWNTRWCCYSAGAIKRFTILTKFSIHGMRKLVSTFLYGSFNNWFFVWNRKMLRTMALVPWANLAMSIYLNYSISNVQTHILNIL